MNARDELRVMRLVTTTRVGHESTPTDEQETP